MSPLAFWVAVALAPYWLGPIVVWLTQRVSARPRFELFAPGRHAVTADVAVPLRQMCDALAQEGFRVVADLFLSSHVKHVTSRVVLLEHSETAELAVAVTAFTPARPTRPGASHVELPTKLGDGRSVTVNNNSVLGPFTAPPTRIVVRLPDVRDPARLLRIKRAYLDRRFAGVARVRFDHQDDPMRFLSEAMVREMTEQVEAGTYRRDDVAGVFRPTFTGAWLMTWRLLPPWRNVRMARVRRRAAALLKELGMEGRDPQPIASPAARRPVSWPLLIALAALVLYLGRSTISNWSASWWRESVTIPSDFVLPDDFRGAVGALERIADATATPLFGMDSLGDSIATGGFAVSVPATRAAALVAKGQARFLEKGFYLFRSEQHFGIGNRQDRVALFPRRDPYEIIRLMGTNGANYNIGSDSIVAWLRALEREQPFVLTGIDFDWLEGRFTSAIRDPADLARRFYAFCPDIVEQGTGDVAALAAELRRSQRLYCWWD